MSENLKLNKVNKKFRTWTKRELLSVSSVFGFLYVYAYEHCERFMHVNILVVFLDLYITRVEERNRQTWI